MFVAPRPRAEDDPLFAVRLAIGAVLAVYPSSAVEMDALGLHVIPGTPHVGARPPRREMP